MRALSSWLGLLALLAFTTLSAHGSAGDAVHILILKEHGVGSSASAQAYVDKLMAKVAQQNGWAAAEGKYLTKRSLAKKYIDKKKPAFGMLSLAAFLNMRDDVEVLGQVEVSTGGGRQYHLISKNAAGLAGCKGKTLASDHADDSRFIDKVVGAGSFTLSDFTLVETRRPVQTIKKVVKGEAECALVDDAQLAELAHVDGAAGIRSVWSSQKLPPMAAVAFSGADAASRAKFKSTLGSICAGAGKSVCDEAGITALKPADKSAYASVIAAYDK